MNIYELDSPAVYFDLNIFEKNAKQIKADAVAAGKKVRPHFKAHKSLYIASKQVEQGFNDGFTTARLSEAEVLAESGFDNLLVAFPLVGKEKCKRYANLNNKVTLYTTVDSMVVAEGLNEACGPENPAHVLIELDMGVNRCGIQPEEIGEFTENLLKLPGIVVDGIFEINENMYFCMTEEERRQSARWENEVLGKAIDIIKDLGVEVKIVSVGNTPCSLVMEEYSNATEIRVGKRFFFDVSDIDSGYATEEDCALRILATVVSTTVPGKATIDAGTKRMTSDRSPFSQGFGKVTNYSNVQFVNCHEEHGFLTYDINEQELKVGDRINIIPNHACVISNLCDYVYSARGETVVDKYKVDARGMEF